MIKRTLSASLIAITFATGAFAQLVETTTGAGAPVSGGALGQPEGFSNVTTSFDGIDVQVLRLIADPAGDGAVRLVMRFTSTAKEDRRLLFVRPSTTLIDELGNEYRADDAVGIEICLDDNPFDRDVDWCRRHGSEIATRLAPGVPINVAMRFRKAEDNFSEELAAMSNSVSLRSRIAYYPEDFSANEYADVIVNDIPMPGS